jgi:hypothetical protein
MYSCVPSLSTYLNHLSDLQKDICSSLTPFTYFEGMPSMSLQS